MRLAGAGAVGLVLALGCGGLVDAGTEWAVRQGTEWALESLGAGKWEITENGVKITNADGSVEFLSNPGEMPEGFPVDAIDGATIAGSGEIESADRSVKLAILQVPGKGRDACGTWYTDHLESRGFTVTRVDAGDRNASILVGRSGDEAVMVVAVDGENGTDVQLLTGPADHARFAPAGAELLPAEAPPPQPPLGPP